MPPALHLPPPKTQKQPEKPEGSPFANIAADLALPADCVNIKGKTNETLGYLGRCEAIEAQAVVLLQAA